MVLLENWRYDGISLWGICRGHDKLADGTYIHTSPVVKIEPCNGGLDVYTHSGTHYCCRTEDICLDALEETRETLKEEKVDISFLDNAEELVANRNREYEKDINGVLEDDDLYIEFIGVYVRKAYFKKDGELLSVPCVCHVGTFQDSYLLRKTGIVDVRYFDRMFRVDFYHVSDGINNIHIKYTGDTVFRVTGIGDGLKFEPNETGIKTIKPERCKEGLFSPDCVNGKSLLLSGDYPIG